MDPFQKPPSISLSCPWLSRGHISRLEQKLLELREEQGGGVILFTWLSFLQEDSLAFLGMENVIRVAELCEADQSEASSDHVEEVKSDKQASGSSVQNTCDKIDEEKMATSVDQPVVKVVPSERKQMHRRYSVRTFVGTVKKWKQIDDRSGHGFIKMSDGREYSFHSRDCHNTTKDSEGLISFRKGDQVTFEEQLNTGTKKHHNTPKAVNVANFFEDDIDRNGMTNQLSEEANEIGSDQINEITSNNSSQEMPIPTEPMPTEKKETVDHAPKTQRKRISRRQKLVTLFREFDQMKKEEVFSSSLQSCDICFTDKVSSPLIG